MALKTHPDKSGLGKDFFLFFMKAYKMLEAIYEYRCKKEQCVKKQEYTAEMDTENKHLLKKLDGKSAKDFNTWFNKMFEEVRVKDEDVDTGYGSWFKSNEDINNEKVEGLGQMREAIERRKKETRALVKHNGIRDMEVGGGYGLARQKPQEYCSDIFSNLQYEDLKKAHTENIIPVSEEDYDPAEHFRTVTQLQNYREKQDMSPLNTTQTNRYLENKEKLEARENTRRAFLLAKQMEEGEKKNEQILSKFKYLH